MLSRREIIERTVKSVGGDISRLPPTVTIRRSADDELTIKFSERITEDIQLVEGPDGEVPAQLIVDYLQNAIELGLAGDVAAGCERCGKNCFWIVAQPGGAVINPSR